MALKTDEFSGVLGKRVIGLPGENIKFESGNVYIDGEKLEDILIVKLMPYRKICRNCVKYNDGDCKEYISPYGNCEEGEYSVTAQ